MKIYVITSGEYSDYSVDAMFLNKDDADEYCRIENEDHSSYGRGSVEEWEEYNTLPERFAHLSTHTTVDLDGNPISQIFENIQDHWAMSPREKNTYVHISAQQVGRKAGEQFKPTSYVVSVSGPVERARKVLSERLARIKADIDNGVPITTKNMEQEVYSD